MTQSVVTVLRPGPGPADSVDGDLKPTGTVTFKFKNSPAGAAAARRPGRHGDSDSAGTVSDSDRALPGRGLARRRARQRPGAATHSDS